MTQGLLTAALLLLALAIPGWAIIGLTGTTRDWRPLQRWCLALTLGIAFYPVLFYALRAVVPAFSLGRFAIVALLLGGVVLAGWTLRREWRSLFALELSDWLVIAVIGATLFTRYWIIRDQPYPAWSDSLQHVLIAKLTADAGRLPTDLMPYAPTPLQMYHLGLYSLSAVAQWLSGCAPHTALLWTAQTLNGLVGLGVVLVLDRRLGRTAALAGAVTAGLLSHQPAYYVNWGRFTQVSSQSVLLPAFLLSWEAVRLRTRQRQRVPRLAWGCVVLAALLNAGVFLLHFRVSAFYLALLGLALAWELFRALRNRLTVQFLTGVAAVGLVSLLFVLPAVAPAVSTYLGRAAAEAGGSSAEHAASEAIYHAISWDAVPLLVARPWLLALAGAAALLGVVRRNRITMLALGWVILLLAIGSAHRLGIPALDLTNLSGVLIGFYLPISLLVGAGAHEFVRLASGEQRLKLEQAVIYGFLVAGFVLSHLRTADVESYRYFVTDDDVRVMEWIKTNTPADARFAINTYFWMPDSPHGTDAGYWIPYFTGRQTTSSTMLFVLTPGNYKEEILKMSRAADQLDIPSLKSLGVRYIYSGARGDFAGVGLRRDALASAGGLRLLFESGPASVWEIEGEAS